MAPRAPEPPRSLEKRLDQYIEVYKAPGGGPDDFFTQATIQELVDFVFEHPGSPEYIQRLKTIDARVGKDPEPIYELAKALQLEWQAKHGAGLGKRLVMTRDASVKVGFSTGAAVALTALLVVASFERGKAPPFRLIRALYPAAKPVATVAAALPLVGSAAGYGIGTLMNSTGMLEENIPLAPAHVMSLGISEEDFVFDAHTLEKELGLLAVSTAASSLIVRALPWIIRGVRVANVAATPGKIHPVVAFITTVVIGYIIDRKLNSMLKEYEFDELKGKLVTQAGSVQLLLNKGQRVQAFQGSGLLVKHVLGLVHSINKDLNERIQDFTVALQEVHKKYGIKVGENPKPSDEVAFRYETDLLTERMGRDIRDMMADRGELTTSEDYVEYVTLNHLAEHGTRGWDGLPSDILRHAGVIQRGFDVWLQREQKRVSATISGEPLEQLFKDYAFQLRRILKERLADSLVDGQVTKDPSLSLLQTACFLDSSGEKAMGKFKNILLSTVASNVSSVKSYLAMYREPQPARPSESIELPPGGVPQVFPDAGVPAPAKVYNDGGSGAGPGPDSRYSE